MGVYHSKSFRYFLAYRHYDFRRFTFEIGDFPMVLGQMAQVKTSKIVVRNNEKTASFHKPEDGEKVIQIFKNADDIEPDFFDKSS